MMYFLFTVYFVAIGNSCMLKNISPVHLNHDLVRLYRTYLKRSSTINVDQLLCLDDDNNVITGFANSLLRQMQFDAKAVFSYTEMRHCNLSNSALQNTETKIITDLARTTTTSVAQMGSSVAQVVFVKNPEICSSFLPYVKDVLFRKLHLIIFTDAYISEEMLTKIAEAVWLKLGLLQIIWIAPFSQYSEYIYRYDPHYRR